jgi:hypothetical protein
MCGSCKIVDQGFMLRDIEFDLTPLLFPKIAPASRFAASIKTEEKSVPIALSTRIEPLIQYRNEVNRFIPSASEFQDANALPLDILGKRASAWR